ncbi:MAG: redox-sensitive bicupin YhaK (pirin superfamily) [Myxococcota bacterium]|jgi:redox-sensitive bicupin YhaK (pirin superfamily)
MNMQIHRASQRGHANHGWLDSHHTFSFAGYYDPKMMGFGHLRVINQDTVAAGRGFGRHPHRNMEIISYVLDGALAHEDTTGSGGVLRHGDVQTMSAGRGVAHSEMNASETDPVHFLQIWLLPRQGNTEPEYAQQFFDLDERGLRLVVSPDGRDGSLQIGQDTDLYRVLMDANDKLAHDVKRQRAWIQIVRGELLVEGVLLQPGDGLAIDGADALRMTAQSDVEALLFDLL